MPISFIEPASAISATRDEPARLCFRYDSGGKHPRVYDVILTLDDPDVCRIEICHAMPAGADLPPFTGGRISTVRLMRAVDLVGLVKQVTRQDRTTFRPGRLVFDAHLRTPKQARSSIVSADARQVPSSPARKRRHMSRLVPPPSALPVEPALRAAHAGAAPAIAHAHDRVRYPLRGMGRGARLVRRAQTRG